MKLPSEIIEEIAKQMSSQDVMSTNWEQFKADAIIKYLDSQVPQEPEDDYPEKDCGCNSHPCSHTS